jgi:hypothetical protein
VPWPEALDRLCRQQEVSCEHYKDSKLLRVRPLDAVPGFPLPAGYVDTANLALRGPELSPVGSSGPKGLDLGLRLQSAKGEAVQGLARFGWTSPLRGLVAGDWGFQVSWIPLAAEHRLLLPMVLPCGGPAHFFEPLTLPLDKPWQGRFEGRVGEIGPVPEGLEQWAGREPCENRLEGGFQVTLHRAGASSEEAGKVRLPGPPGSYILVHPPSDKGPSMAVVSLEGFAEKRRVGLLYLAGGKPVFERHPVAAGAGATLPIPLGGGGYEILVQHRE